MRRRVYAESLKRVGELTKFPENAGSWYVCDEYELREESVFARYPVGPPFKGKDWDWKGWKSYRPLEDVPDLFFKLAYLYEEPDFEEAVLAFCHRYGVLGGGSSRTVGWLHKTHLSWFREEAKRALGILRMYEAVLNRDWQQAELLLLRGHVQEIIELVGTDQQLLAGLRKDLSDEDLPGVYLQDALIGSVIMVQATVNKVCRPAAVFAESVFFPEADPSGIKGVWEFNNLVGAAYLQMYWLMTSGGTLTRCEYCGRVMSLGRPQPEGRKRRQDKRFCDDACRQAHHRAKKRALPSP